MKIGLQLPVFASDGAAIREFAVAAEVNGFDSVWTGDHFVIPAVVNAPYPYAWRFSSDIDDLFPIRNFLEAVSLCGFVTGATSTLKMGVGIFVLPMRNPVAFAKELATLDLLSSGRILVGIGAGWLAEEFEALGLPFAERGERTDEYIAIMRALWGADQPVGFKGKYHSFKEVYCEPLPFTPGGPPIWVGGHTPAALRRCARLSDGWHAIELSPDEFSSHNARLDELLRSEERAPEEVARTVALRLRLSGDSIDEAVDLVDAYAERGCDLLVVLATASRSVEENVIRAKRLRDALGDRYI